MWAYDPRPSSFPVFLQILTIRVPRALIEGGSWMILGFPKIKGAFFGVPIIRIIVIWGFPKIRGTFLGVPIIRIIVFWGLYWGPLI